MKKQKLKLEDLQVKSFVTSMEGTQKQTIEGGITPTILPLTGLTASIISNITKSIIENHTNQSCVIIGNNTEVTCLEPNTAGECSIGQICYI